MGKEKIESSPYRENLAKKVKKMKNIDPTAARVYHAVTEDTPEYKAEEQGQVSRREDFLKEGEEKSNLLKKGASAELAEKLVGLRKEFKSSPNIKTARELLSEGIQINDKDLIYEDVALVLDAFVSWVESGAKKLPRQFYATDMMDRSLITRLYNLDEIVGLIREFDSDNKAEIMAMAKDKVFNVVDQLFSTLINNKPCPELLKTGRCGGVCENIRETFSSILLISKRIGLEEEARSWEERMKQEQWI